ncbi:MAG: ABC transporter substrate-binding protein [Burkholderiales bacterium]
MIKKLIALAAAAVGLHGGAVAQETIKIGLMPIDAGPMVVYNNYTMQPAELAVETFNAQGGALGRKYELVVQAHAGPPAAAIAAATKLVQQGGVSFLNGIATSAIASAISPKLSGLNAIYFDTGSSLEELTGKNCQPNYFRTSASDGILFNMIREAVKDGKIKTWNMLVADYSAGHQHAKHFASLVQELGGSVQTTLFAPLSTTDFGSHIAQLNSKPADGLAVFIIGAGSVALAKQQQQFGLFSKYKQVMSWYFANDMTLPAMGDTLNGVFSVMSYAWDMPGDKNAAFVKAFEEKFKRKPTFGDADNYAAYELLHAAILKAKSTDVDKVRAALSGLKVSTVLGNVEMRAADHQLVRPMVLAQVLPTKDGKSMMGLRFVEPAQKVTPPPSGECKF